jgi:hypothetical protein
MIEKFASRARAYICTYHHLHQEHKQAAAENTKIRIHLQELLYSDMERLSKAFKGHRCALDVDCGFVHSELRYAMIKEE